MLFIINTECNRDCSYCFEGELRQQTPRMMTVEDIHRIARWAGPSAMASNKVLGGEPTLHPQLLPIMDAIGSYSQEPPLLLTNGVGAPEVMRELAKRPVRFLVNLNHLDAYSGQEQSRLTKNLEIIRDSHFQVLYLSVTITTPEDDFAILFDLLRSPLGERVPAVRIGISTPGYGFKNSFPREFSHDFGAAYVRLATAIHCIRPYIQITNECALNGCLVDKATVASLQGVVDNFQMNCKGGGNFDILPDFSTHWCYAADAIPGLRIDNIFKYQSMAHVQYELFMAQERLQRSLGAQCNHNTCDSLACHGPCVVQNYYRKNRKQIDAQAEAQCLC